MRESSAGYTKWQWNSERSRGRATPEEEFEADRS